MSTFATCCAVVDDDPPLPVDPDDELDAAAAPNDEPLLEMPSAALTSVPAGSIAVPSEPAPGSLPFLSLSSSFELAGSFIGPPIVRGAHAGEPTTEPVK